MKLVGSGMFLRGDVDVVPSRPQRRAVTNYGLVDSLVPRARFEPSTATITSLVDKSPSVEIIRPRSTTKKEA